MHPPPPPPLFLPPRTLAIFATFFSLGASRSPFTRGRVEDLFLDVRGEQRQVHHRGDARAGESCQAGDVGVVGDLAAADHGLERVRQGEYAGEARNLSARGWVGRGGSLHHGPMPGASGGEVNLKRQRG